MYAFDEYVETCVCDSSLCNVDANPMDFYCHGGDLDISILEEIPEYINQTHSCYTNRNQCFIMKYSGSFGERARFGCAPLDFDNQPDQSWIITDFKSLKAVEVYSCYKSLCNSVDVITNSENTA